MINFFRRVRLKLDNLGIFRMDDASYLRLKYLAMMGKQLDLESPKTFNEKLQWLKLYDRKPEYTKMVDKYEVKKYVAEKIGEQYVIPTIGVYDRFEGIDFDKLPNQFVIKCTHDSGGLYICRDKKNMNIEDVKKKINDSLSRNYFWSAREWPYKNVRPRILAEEYMSDETQPKLVDYKFYCFNGEPKFLYVSVGLEDHQTAEMDFFDLDFKKMPFRRGDFESLRVLPKKPKNFNLMVNMARKLANGTSFVRVDLYEINNRVYFSELTFTPCAGMMPFEPEEWDEKIGEMLVLPRKKDDEK